MKKLKVTVILESIVVVFLLIIVFITNSEFIKSSEELIRYEGESKNGIYKAQVVQIGDQ